MRLLIPALKLFIKNIKTYILSFLLLIACTVLINGKLSELFAKTRYTDDIRHFSEKDAYLLSQFLSIESGIPSLSDDELSDIKGINKVMSCNCSRTTLNGLMQMDFPEKAKEVYVAYTTNGYTDEVKIPLLIGRHPKQRYDGVYEILVSQSLSKILQLNNEYVFNEVEGQYNVFVVGILAEGNVFLSLSGSGNASSYFKEITSAPPWIIIPKEHSYIKSYIKIVFFDESLNPLEKDDLIVRLNTDYGYTYSFRSVYSELLESVKREIADKLPSCALLLLICITCVTGCVSLNTLNDMKIYGIFRLCGATKRKCVTVASLINLFLILSSLLFSVPIFNMYASVAYRQPPYISWRNYAITILIYTASFIVSAVIPRTILNKTIFNLYSET